MPPRAPGTYALILACHRNSRIRIGRLGSMQLRSGYFVYIGSAFGSGGLYARIAHHRRLAMRPRWHIDYLRRHTRPEAVWFRCGVRCEHEWAATLGAVADQAFLHNPRRNRSRDHAALAAAARALFALRHQHEILGRLHIQLFALLADDCGPLSTMGTAGLFR